MYDSNALKLKVNHHVHQYNEGENWTPISCYSFIHMGLRLKPIWTVSDDAKTSDILFRQEGESRYRENQPSHLK